MPFLSLQQAAAIVHQSLPPTPQIRWPLLCEALGCEVWMKHENHLPVGAFKLRGGLVYFHHLAHQGERPAGVISATRGNHGQSVASRRAATASSRSSSCRTATAARRTRRCAASARS